MGAPLAVADERALSELDDVRQRLDDLDRQLVEILARRFESGNQAARLKAELGMPMHDPAREEQVMEQAAEWARAAGLPEAEVAELFRRLIAISRTAQINSRGQP